MRPPSFIELAKTLHAPQQGTLHSSLLTAPSPEFVDTRVQEHGGNAGCFD
jgi:hypothetical protein